MIRQNYKSSHTGKEIDDAVDAVDKKQNVISQSNKLSADLVSDANCEHKFVTAEEKAEWSSKGTYSKPEGGIPPTDLSSDVQASLGKAGTALQEETDPTVPAWAKADTKPTYTAFEVGAVPTTRKVNGKALSADITLTATDVNAIPNTTVIPDAQIQSDWNETNAGEKDFIKNKPDIYTKADTDILLSSKQDKLISGTNIKTINHQSLLGSGNIVIQGGGGGGGAIDSISVNGTPQPIDEGNVDITVPTKVSDLTNDSGFITSYTETDPVFVSSPAHGITSADITKWDAAAVVADDDGSATTPDFDAEADTVWHKAQTLSSAQKAQARTNIGAQEELTFDTAPTLASTNPVTSGGVYTALGNKQDTLVSGTNIKTINNNSLLGSGNISISSGDTNVIEGIKMNNTALTPDANKVVDLGTVITAHQDISGKADKSEMIVSASGDQTTITLKSGTSATVINAHQSLSGKQDTLVSGTNIKTINNESLLGSGNITIQGGGGSGVQSDWNETDTTSEAYILNKPSVISAEFSYDSTNEGLVINPASAVSYDSTTESLTIL